jgi:hypothetical protein
MNHRHIESFLLRLVVADSSSANPETWRGRIQHVGSGYERQFEHLHDIVLFIREHVDGDSAMFISCDELMSAE